MCSVSQHYDLGAREFAALCRTRGWTEGEITRGWLLIVRKAREARAAEIAKAEAYRNHFGLLAEIQDQEVA